MAFPPMPAKPKGKRKPLTLSQIIRGDPEDKDLRGMPPAKAMREEKKEKS